MYKLSKGDTKKLYEFLRDLRDPIPEWFETCFMPYEVFLDKLNGFSLEHDPKIDSFEDVKYIMERDFIEVCENSYMQEKLMASEELYQELKRETEGLSQNSPESYLEMPDEECLFTLEEYKEMYKTSVDFFEGNIPNWFIEGYMPFEKFLKEIKPTVEQDGIEDLEVVKSDIVEELKMVEAEEYLLEMLKDMEKDMGIED